MPSPTRRISNPLIVLATGLLLAVPVMAAGQEMAFAPFQEGALLEQPANLEVVNEPLSAALVKLDRASSVRIAFSESFLPVRPQVSCDCSSLTVREALDRLLGSTDLDYTEIRGRVLIEPRSAPREEVRHVRLASTTANALPAARVSGRSGSTIPAVRQGTITGQVVAAQTGRPITGAQVFIEGTGLGTLTNASGEFALSGVPAGTVTVQARTLGYRTEEVVVDVVSGETVTANFSLREQALGLDEVVVTGTPGQARRREVGNTIAQIDVGEPDGALAGVDDLIQGRAAGVSVMPSSGIAGSGAQIRLRGNVSVAMSNQPIVYVDGVRVRSEGYPKSGAELLDSDIRGSNDAAGALGDINPNDIERIEIIKGSAATTLYGTEAAAGVIQIFTKRGESGDPVWNLQVDQGATWLQPFGTESLPHLNLDRYLQTGHTQNYSLSVRGGTEAVRYFLSTAFEDNEGVLPLDHVDRWAVRGNVGFQPSTNVQVNVNTAYNRSEIQNTPSGNNAQGVVYNAYTEPGGFFVGEDIDRLLEYDIRQNIARFTTGATVTHTPWDRLTNRLTVGFDRADNEQRNLRPFGFIAHSAGQIQTNHFSNEILSIDYASTLTVDVTDNILTRLSWGAQGTRDDTHMVQAASRRFPGPGAPTVSSGAEQAAGEERLKVINAGVFAQALFDISDRYFVTLGVRIDGNSAFGEDFGLQAYPKLSTSYVISDETFWPAGWGEMKLRAAFGESGRAPGAFDAVRTWNPIGWGGLPALAPNQVGNPELGPERTREVEVGFDASFMDDRIRTEVTYYHQRTMDALMPVLQVPSMGFTGSQLENVGELQNQGFEVTLNTTPYQSRSLTADLGLTVATNRSEVLDLGGAAEFNLGQEGWIMEGHPVPVMYAPHVTNADEFADPIIEMHHFGPNVPTRTIGLNGQLTFANGMRVSALAEHQGGHYIKNRAFRTMAQRSVAPQCAENGYYDAIESGQVGNVNAFWRTACTPTLVDGRMFIVPADFIKLRTVNVTLPLPFSIPGSEAASVSVSGHNLWQRRNSDILLLDPEMGGNFGMNSPVREIVETIPPATRLVASLRVTF